MDNRGWIRAEDKLPGNGDKVLVLASGEVNKYAILINAYMLAGYYSDEGFILDEFPTAENIIIEWWRPLPDMPEGVKAI